MSPPSRGAFVRQSYHLLRAAYGDLQWWPAKTPFEVIVGAILTQGTAWRNVAQALARLERAHAMHPARLRRLPRRRLERLLRPAGFFRVKARRLQAFLRWLQQRFQGSVARMCGAPTRPLRRALLAVEGIGPETADAILLYAGGRAQIVVDAYTRRILQRHGLIGRQATYDEVAALLARALPRRAAAYNAYHAWIVEVGKRHCRTRPRCQDCPLGGLPLADGRVPRPQQRSRMTDEVTRG